MARKKKFETQLVCPECDSNEVLVRAETSYNVNTGDFYCHSVKTHDSYASCSCQTCGWEGQRSDLKEVECPN